jgi:hypothetical protein
MAVDPESKPGFCPLCGETLAFQYIDTFVETANRVITLGKEFVHQLIGLAELAGSFAIERESVTQPVEDALANQDKLIAQPYEPRWPPRPSQPVG